MDVLTDKKLTRLVATKDMTRVYELEDGQWLTAKDETVAWRNNNPGNLKFEFNRSADKTVKSTRSKERALASAQNNYDGVVDLDQWGNAVFETYEAGRDAQRKHITDAHIDHTVEELVKGYSRDDYSGKTHHEGQVKTIYATAAAEGFDLHGKTFRQMTDDEKNALLDGVARAEYWKAGTTQETGRLNPDELAEALKTPSSNASHAHSVASQGDGRVHRQGDRGEAVGRLQSDLSSLGVTARDGSTIQADQDFGSRTKQAVEAFQQAHGLHVDGVAGKETLAAIEAAKTQMQTDAKQKVPSLLDTHHPAHGLYEQAYQCVSRLDAEQGRQPGPHTQMFAGSLTAAATAAGFNRIDHVVLNDDASRGWAVQGDLNSPFKQYTDVGVMQAIQTPLSQSSQEASQNVQNNLQVQAQQQQQMQQDTLQQGPVMGR